MTSIRRVSTGQAWGFSATAGRSFTAGWSRISELAHLYLIGLGSNQRHPLIGSPASIIAQAIAALETGEIDVYAHSAIIESAPLGPSQRRFANAAAILASPLSPPELLDRLQSVEVHFGRVRRGQRWRARTLDLDIILWSGGIWSDDASALNIPHRDFRSRGFVLGPAMSIAARWKDPVTGLDIRQLYSRFIRPKPLDPAPPRH